MSQNKKVLLFEKKKEKWKNLNQNFGFLNLNKSCTFFVLWVADAMIIIPRDVSSRGLLIYLFIIYLFDVFEKRKYLFLLGIGKVIWFFWLVWLTQVIEFSLQTMIPLGPSPPPGTL